MTELMRLKINRGWSVIDNKLYDTEPIVKNKELGFIENWHEGFIEDVLWIREHRYTTEQGFMFPTTNYFSIDGGWNPDSSIIDGTYHVTLSWVKPDDYTDIEVFYSTNRFEIRDKIEFWMTDIEINYSSYLEKINAINN